MKSTGVRRFPAGPDTKKKIFGGKKMDCARRFAKIVSILIIVSPNILKSESSQFVKATDRLRYCRVNDPHRTFDDRKGHSFVSNEEPNLTDICAEFNLVHRHHFPLIFQKRSADTKLLRLLGGFEGSESDMRRKRKRKTRSELLQPSVPSSQKRTNLPPSLRASGYQGPMRVDTDQRRQAVGNYESQERRPANEDLTQGQPQARNWLGKKLREIKKSKQVHGILSRLRAKAAKEFASVHQSSEFPSHGNSSSVPILSGVQLQEAGLVQHNLGNRSSLSRFHKPQTHSIEHSMPSQPKQRAPGEKQDRITAMPEISGGLQAESAGSISNFAESAVKKRPSQGRVVNSTLDKDEHRKRGGNWLLSAYEKRRAEIDAQRSAAAAARDARLKAKAAALEERRRWRKRLGARTRTGQPVMEHVVQRLMVQMHRSELRAAAAEKNSPAPAEAAGQAGAE
jgi:hypothetical protein